MSKKAKQVDVVIVGIGMVGLSSANLLAMQGKTIAIVDRDTPAEFKQDQEYEARVTAVSPGTKAIFEHVGAWQAMQNKRVAAFDAMTVWDEGSNAKISFLAKEIQQPNLGYIVENLVIQSSLYECLQAQSNASRYIPINIKQIITQPECIEVHLDNDEIIHAKLLIGADGVRSSVRNLAEISFVKKSYHQQGIIALIQPEHSHQNTAWQRFLSTGPLALLPLSNGQCSIVWTASDDYADELLKMNAQEFEQAITKASDFQLGKISLCSKRASFPLNSGHAEKIVQPRVALIGDAAHSLHPLAGQGANLGFTDAAVLADILNTTRDFGSYKLLRKYERARAGETQIMQTAMDAFVKVFGSTSDSLVTARKFALNATDQIKPVKNFFMQHAMGLNKDRPTYAR